LNLGTYQSANRPIATAAAQVQIHHRASAGRRPRMMSSTISATAHPAVPTTVTSRSFASSGGGGDSRDCFTRPGYEEAAPLRAEAMDTARGCGGPAGVMYLVHALAGAD
jgi:hypothetical protein